MNLERQTYIECLYDLDGVSVDTIVTTGSTSEISEFFDKVSIYLESLGAKDERLIIEHDTWNTSEYRILYSIDETDEQYNKRVEADNKRQKELLKNKEETLTDKEVIKKLRKILKQNRIDFE